jgi:hypothetical protein
MKKRNYGWFYTLLRRMPEADKDSLVLQFTDGRTTHLHEMRENEYIEMCQALEQGAEDRERIELRKARSSALLRLGRLGISTIDNWDGINAFCLSPKIAGKEFGRLSIKELHDLTAKLEAIIRKGGLKKAEVERDREDVIESIVNNAMAYARMYQSKNRRPS